MKRGLVMMDDTDAHRELLTEAGEHALGADTDLVVLTVMTEEEYEDDTETLASIGSIEGTSYDSSAVLDAAADRLRDLTAEVLPEDVSVTAVARAADEDERATTVIDTALDHDCDHVFVLGQRRSPTGKAIFGDVAQRIVLNFDGYVTLKTS